MGDTILFTDWGIHLEDSQAIPQDPPRLVQYAERLEIEKAIGHRYPQPRPRRQLRKRPELEVEPEPVWEDDFDDLEDEE